MNLAELIHRALNDPKFRLAVETGKLNIADINLKPAELKAATQVMKYAKAKDGTGLLPDVYAIWRE